MKFEITKIDAAVDQLDWAIKLFLDKSAYVPAITLAAAAEEIIGGTLVESSASQHVKQSLESKFNLPGPDNSQQHLNKGKNWVMHWRDMGDEETTEIDLETEAVLYIVRAITNLFDHDQSLSSESPRLLEWLNKNKPEILESLEFGGHIT
jgi:hypothetical protein